MYPVSDKYIEAFRSPVRCDKLTGVIKLKNGSSVVLDDKMIVQGKTSMTRRVFSKFNIGSATCAELNLSIFDKDAFDHDYSGALIRLTYSLRTSRTKNADGTYSEEWEDVLLPHFYADGKKVTRSGDVVTIKAYDGMSKLNIALPDNIPTDTMYNAISYIVNYAKLGFSLSAEEFAALPNSGIAPDFTSESIQTCRDAVMWVSQLVGCCTFMDYRGILVMKPFQYTEAGTYDRLITADERARIEYTDTRTYLAYLSSYCAGEPKNYSAVSTWDGSDPEHIKEGALSISKNPLVNKLTAEEQDAVNMAYLSARSRPTRYIRAQGTIDPAIEPLDVVAFQGGSIDLGRKLIAPVTTIKWKYRGKGSIECQNVEEYAEAADEAQSVSVLAADDTGGDTAAPVQVQPKSQIEKRLDELEAGSGTGTATKLIDASGSQYLKGNFLEYKYNNIGFYGTDANGSSVKRGEFCVRDGYFMLFWDGKEVVSFAESGNIMLQTMDGTTLKLTTTGNGEILEIQSKDYPKAALSVHIGDDGSGSIGFRNGGSLSFRADGLYYNGQKVLLQE